MPNQNRKYQNRLKKLRG